MGTPSLWARVTAVAGRQLGLVTLAQLADLRVGRRQIQTWVEQRRLERVLPGVLRVAGTATSRAQSLLASVLWGGRDALLSHRAGGELWGYDGVTANRPDITVPASVKKRSRLVVVHHSDVPDVQRRMRHGIPVTSPERTIIDLAGVLTARRLEIAFESARHERLVTVESTARALAGVGAKGRRGAASLSALLTTLADEAPAESALEVLVARVLRESNLPKPQRQLEVVAFGKTYRLDFAWPDLGVALECDGQKWHSDFERDRKRWSAIGAATGYRFVFATWKRINDEPDQLVEEVRRRTAHRFAARDATTISRAAATG